MSKRQKIAVNSYRKYYVRLCKSMLLNQVWKNERMRDCMTQRFTDNILTKALRRLYIKRLRGEKSPDQ